MASDVRSLLRNERLARRVDDPHASYSAGGRLSCTVCNVNLKADSLWAPHTKSKEHRRRLQLVSNGLPARPADARVPEPPPASAAKPAIGNGSAEPAPPPSKKRKADDSDQGGHGGGSETRKKARPAPRLPSSFVMAAPPPTPSEFPPTDTDVVAPRASTTITEPIPTALQPNTTTALPAPVSVQNEAGTVDEAEWAAFQRDVVASPSPPPPLANALTTSATIEAAPVSAEELAARSREEASVQRREKQQQDAEGEKEEAQQRMEEEFEEMDRLEDRVRRLKERREALRNGEPMETDGEAQIEDERGKVGEVSRNEPAKVNGVSGDESSQISEDEDDEYDDGYDDFEGWGRR